MGARLRLLLRAAIGQGGVAPRNLPLFTLMLLSALGRAPFGVLEHAIAARRKARAPAMEPPLFIVGHWRTGTTHLHNLMGRSPAYGHISPLASGLPDQLLTLATWLRPWIERALPEDRKVDRVAVMPDSPQEDEIPLASQQPLSVFHAVYFPRHFQRGIDRGVFFDGVSGAEIERWKRLARNFAEKVAVHQGTPRLVIKNPVYTGRIARLREIWPEAKFIHIRRNPYEVFVSTRHYYRKLLPDLALQPFEHVHLERFILETFTRLMARYEADRTALDEGKLAEIRYEDLVRSPMDVLEGLHDRLTLPGWDDARPRIQAYLDDLRDYSTNRYEITDADRRKVDEHWPEAVEKWKTLAG